MRYFFKDANNCYFNPLSCKRELCIFNLEILEFKTYTTRSYIEANYNDEGSFIDLDRYSITTVFLCIVQHEKGLYLSYDYTLSKIPCIWNFDDDKNILFIPWYHQGFQSSLKFTNETNTAEEFYSLNGYYIYKKNNMINEEFLNLCKSLNLIEDISYVLKTPNVYDIFCNRIFHHKDQPDVWFNLQLHSHLYEDPGDRYSFFIYDHQIFLKSHFLSNPSIIICSNNTDIQLQFTWIHIPRVQLQF
jgi:hypothetical protein